MKNLRILVLMVFLCLNASYLYSQVTNQQATDIVLNQILAGDLDQIDVFMNDNLKSGTESIALGNHITVNIPYTSNWVYFVDDIPYANWSHSSRFIFVNEANGEYQITNADYFPIDWEDAYTAISEMVFPTPYNMPINPNPVTNNLDPNPNLYAILINGSDMLRYWRDISATYCALLESYGYTKENIFVHYDEGYAGNNFGDDLDGPDDPSDDIDYDAYHASIQHTLAEMSGATNTSPEIPILGPADQLFIFVTDHGYIYQGDGHSYIDLPGDDLSDDLRDTQLATYLEDINCAQIIAIFEPCKIGGFKTELSDYVNYDVSCKNRSIQTASNTENSIAELWITGANYDEFVYYWTAAARGYYPHENHPWVHSYEVGSCEFDLLADWEYWGGDPHPVDYDPDLNGDGFVQMEEAFAYANNFDTWTYDGSNDDYYNPCYGGDDQYYPQEFTDISFEDDLLTLTGLAGRVNTTQVVENRNYMLGGNLTLSNGYNLSLTNSSNFYFGNELANFTVEPFSTLYIGNNVSFFGNTENQILIEGDVRLGDNLTFSSLGDAEYFDGLNLHNTSLQTTIDNANFTEANLRNIGSSLDITNSSFDNCPTVFSEQGAIDVSNTTFNNTCLNLENNEVNQNLARITDCDFTSNIAIAGIELWNYKNYEILDNIIDGYRNGIEISQSGYGNLKKQMIKDNTITNCTQKGILSYSSIGGIHNNNISNNYYGVWFGDHSSMKLYGFSGANTASETQEIRDNTSYEVYASQFSFPKSFIYNVIVDDNNTGGQADPMVYFSGGPSILDVKYNCWEETTGAFDPAEDLYPAGWYLWDPIWCPTFGSGSSSSAENIYNTANNQFDAEDYSGAQSTYESLIEQYPESKYAKASLQELFALEKFVANDYNSLKQYYSTNSTIQSNSDLQKTADFMISKCDIITENWSDAIGYYEEILLDPETDEEEIFAEIDLGYVYLIMENSEHKSSYTGNLPQYKPTSKEQFIENRDYLLSLIPSEFINETMKGNIEELKSGELLQNVPNPFSESTQIWYKLEKESTVQVNIYSYTGQLIKSFNEGSKTKGNHYIDFNASGLQNGIYFYSISINGHTTDSKKMSVLR